MAKKYSEMVIEGNATVTKAFVMGFVLGGKHGGEYYFNKDEGISREALLKWFKELVRTFDYLTCVVMEQSLAEKVRAALEHDHDLPLNFHSEKKIQGASFEFKYEVYSKPFGLKIKKLFKGLPKELVLKGYEPEEKEVPEAAGPEGYAPEHSYQLEASGQIEGSFEKVIELYRRLKEEPLVTTEKIKLEYED